MTLHTRVCLSVTVSVSLCVYVSVCLCACSLWIQWMRQVGYVRQVRRWEVEQSTRPITLNEVNFSITHLTSQPAVLLLASLTTALCVVWCLHIRPHTICQSLTWWRMFSACLRTMQPGHTGVHNIVIDEPAKKRTYVAELWCCCICYACHWWLWRVNWVV